MSTILPRRQRPPRRGEVDADALPLSHVRRTDQERSRGSPPWPRSRPSASLAERMGADILARCSSTLETWQVTTYFRNCVPETEGSCSMSAGALTLGHRTSGRTAQRRVTAAFIGAQRMCRSPPIRGLSVARPVPIGTVLRRRRMCTLGELAEKQRRKRAAAGPPLSACATKLLTSVGRSGLIRRPRSRLAFNWPSGAKSMLFGPTSPMVSRRDARGSSFLSFVNGVASRLVALRSTAALRHCSPGQSGERG